ncbi:MAG: hypothetical protein OEL78_07695, partial [Hyphomicrobiales bacterium]|nr:hypothetical protein [Hyphomicrobiales bacterium]
LDDGHVVFDGTPDDRVFRAAELMAAVVRDAKCQAEIDGEFRNADYGTFCRAMFPDNYPLSHYSLTRDDYLEILRAAFSLLKHDGFAGMKVEPKQQAQCERRLGSRPF